MIDDDFSYQQLRKEQYEYNSPENFSELQNPFLSPYTFIKARFYMEMSAVLVYILLKTNIHPNHVTLVYGFSGLLAGFLISLGKSEFIMVGIFIFFTRGILDWTDGHLARKTGKTSLTGHVLDEYGALLGSVGLGFGLGFFVAQRTDYEFLYYLVFLFPILRLLMIHNYAKSVLVRKIILTDHTGSNITDDSSDSEEKKKPSFFLNLQKFIQNFMDDRARTVDMICLIILIDINLELNLSFYIFIIYILKWFIAFLGSLYVFIRGGYIENEYNEVLKSILKAK